MFLLEEIVCRIDSADPLIKNFCQKQKWISAKNGPILNPKEDFVRITHMFLQNLRSIFTYWVAWVRCRRSYDSASYDWRPVSGGQELQIEAKRFHVKERVHVWRWGNTPEKGHLANIITKLSEEVHSLHFLLGKDEDTFVDVSVWVEVYLLWLNSSVWSIIGPSLSNRSWCYRSTSASSSSNSSRFLLLKMMIRCRCISVGGGYRCGWRREILGRRQKADTLANYTKAGSNKDTGTKGLLRIHLTINP